MTQQYVWSHKTDLLCVSLRFILYKQRLPSYNKTRELFEQFERSTQKRPPNIKRGICADIENGLIHILFMINKAELLMDKPAERAEKLGEGKTVVTVLPDTAERYFSTSLFEE